MALKRSHLVWSVILALLLGLASWYFLRGPKPIEVVVKRVERGQVQDTVTNTRAGTLKACKRAGLSPSLGGQIARLPVKKGDKIKAGTLLMALWNDDRLAQVLLAEREVNAARARARQSCVVADVAQGEANRLLKLRKQGISSEEATERAVGEARAKKAACKAATSTARVSEARLDLARAMLQQTRLLAPFDGIVAEINGEVGEFVTPSPVGVPTPPAIDLVDVGCLYVSAPIDEVDAPQIRVGMSANISLDAFAKTEFTGQVRRIAPYVLDREKQARTVEVEVDFASRKDIENMLPGYSADIEIILAQQNDVLRIPTEAIMEGNTVLVVDSDQTLQKRHIETGLSNWAYTEITKGLTEGEEVVTSVEREGVEPGVRIIRDSTDQPG